MTVDSWTRQRRFPAWKVCVYTTILFALGQEAEVMAADYSEPVIGLKKPFHRDGEATLAPFAALAGELRSSIVKIDVNGVSVGLGLVVDTDGTTATKASQLKPGKLTCWLAGGREVEAEFLIADSKNDVALIRVKTTGLKPIRWASEKPSPGQWAVSAGIEESPQTIGVISAGPRRIFPPRAFAGVELDPGEAPVRIARVMAGLGAERAGLVSGDVLVAVQGVAIKDRADLTAKLRPFQEGQRVRIKYRRGEAVNEVVVEMMMPSEVRNGPGGTRQDRMNRFGSDLSERAEGFDSVLQHDSVLQAWQCGGPLVNLDGKAIGMNIARAGRVASYALPASLAQKVIGDLKSSLRRRAGQR